MARHTYLPYLQAQDGGSITRSARSLVSLSPEAREDININWMRTPKPERKIVQVGDQKYFEDELVPALAGIKPVEG